MQIANSKRLCVNTKQNKQVMFVTLATSYGPNYNISHPSNTQLQPNLIFVLLGKKKILLNAWRKPGFKNGMKRKQYLYRYRATYCILYKK